MDSSFHKPANLFAAVAFVLVSASLHAGQGAAPTATKDIPVAPDLKFVLASEPDDTAQSDSQQPATQQTPPAPDTRTQADRELKQQESQRMLGVVPAFNSV